MVVAAVGGLHEEESDARTLRFVREVTDNTSLEFH